MLIFLRTYFLTFDHNFFFLILNNKKIKKTSDSGISKKKRGYRILLSFVALEKIYNKKIVFISFYQKILQNDFLKTF